MFYVMIKMGRSEINAKFTYNAPVYNPVPPKPQIARPTMRPLMFRVAPQTTDPSSKIRTQVI